MGSPLPYMYSTDSESPPYITNLGDCRLLHPPGVTHPRMRIYSNHYSTHHLHVTPSQKRKKQSNMSLVGLTQSFSNKGTFYHQTLRLCVMCFFHGVSNLFATPDHTTRVLCMTVCVWLYATVCENVMNEWLWLWCDDGDSFAPRLDSGRGRTALRTSTYKAVP
jgi:hypothetical protein